MNDDKIIKMIAKLTGNAITLHKGDWHCSDDSGDWGSESGSGMCLFLPIDDNHLCAVLIDQFGVDITLSLNSGYASIALSKCGNYEMIDSERFIGVMGMPRAVCTLLARAYEHKPYHMYQ